MSIITTTDSPDGEPRKSCDCQIYEQCPICAPGKFNRDKVNHGRSNRDEQEEAATFDTVISAITERLAGFEFTTESEFGINGELVITLRRVGKVNACKITVNLEI